MISSLVLSLSDHANTKQSCDRQNSLQSDVNFIRKALDLKNAAFGEKEDKSVSSSDTIERSPNDVWLQICNFEKTPAIKLSWTQTSLNRKNFRLLNVDPEYVSLERFHIP